MSRPVRRRSQKEDGPAVDGVAWIPSGADGDLAFTVLIDVLRGEAHVVELGHAFRQDMLLPGGIFVPDVEIFVGEKNVGFFVAVNIGHGDPVADFHFRVDVDGTEFRCAGSGGCGKGEGAGEQWDEDAVLHKERGFSRSRIGRTVGFNTFPGVIIDWTKTRPIQKLRSSTLFLR